MANFYQAKDLEKGWRIYIEDLGEIVTVEEASFDETGWGQVLYQDESDIWDIYTCHATNRFELIGF